MNDPLRKYTQRLPILQNLLKQTQQVKIVLFIQTRSHVDQMQPKTLSKNQSLIDSQFDHMIDQINDHLSSLFRTFFKVKKKSIG